MAEFVDSILDSIDDNGNLAGESLVESATSESSEGSQQATSTPDGVGSTKSIETIAPVTGEEGERGGSGVEENGVPSGHDENTNGEGNGASVPNQPASETGSKESGKEGSRHNNYGGRRKKVGEMSALEMAEHKAEKWKRRAKEMRRAKEDLEAEFNKYKDLNPRAFENDEDRMEFLAWRASTAQRLNDMDSDIDALNEEEGREVFQAKVSNFYNERGAAQFEQLDDHYRDALAAMCGNVDPDNVILDFLSGSKYEAPMREVIYRNGKLQEELFRNFGNPMIAAAERLNTLKELERQVKEFYASRSQTRSNGNATGVRQSSTSQTTRTPEGVNPQTTIANQNQMGVRQRFVLPSMRNRVATATAARQGVSASPAGNNNQFAGRKATGSLTRGSEPTQALDSSAQADALFRELMRSGM